LSEIPPYIIICLRPNLSNCKGDIRDSPIIVMIESVWMEIIESILAVIINGDHHKSIQVATIALYNLNAI
jgi:hypothetical protein